MRSAAFITLAAAGVTPAMAQDASNLPGTQSSAPDTVGNDEQADAPVPNTNDGAADEEIVVTGSLFRSTTSATVSPAPADQGTARAAAPQSNGGTSATKVSKRPAAKSKS